jgi:hypothetical protein
VGYYTADSLDTSVSPPVWNDASGLNNHAIFSRGGAGVGLSTDTRSGKTFSFVRGAATDGVRFPLTFNVSNKYTLFHITKYALLQ